MKQPSLTEFKAWAARNRTVALAVITARAFAQVERARVDGYIKPIFAAREFYVSEEMAARRGKAERITNIDHLYMTDLNGQDYLDFLAECDAAHAAHGFKGTPGQCPALVAESLMIFAENALISCATSLFWTDFSACHGEDRKALLDLCLGACVKAAA